MNLPSVNRLLADRVCQRSFDFSRTVPPKWTKIEKRTFRAVARTECVSKFKCQNFGRVYVIDKRRYQGQGYVTLMTWTCSNSDGKLEISKKPLGKLQSRRPVNLVSLKYIKKVNK